MTLCSLHKERQISQKVYCNRTIVKIMLELLMGFLTEAR